MSASKKRFPYLNGYLQKAHEEQEQYSGGVAIGYGCLATALATMVAGFVGARFLGFLTVPVALAVGTLVGVVVGRMVSAGQKKRMPSSRVQQAWAVADEMRRLRSGRKLHKWVDPSILQLLEAAAYHWTRVHNSLAGPAWASPNLPGHWASVRDQAAQAAQDAMADVIILARSCMGPPAKDKEEMVKEVFEDFADLDIAEALQGLKTLSKQDWTASAHQSPQARTVFMQARPIAERLQSLADEVERAAVEVGSSQVFLPATPEATQSIDAVLGELRAIKQAETELDQQLGQGS